MSTWNYRALRKTDPDSDTTSYDIYEVYYRDDGSIDCWTAESVKPSGETLAELREDRRHFLHAFRRPVLEEQQVDGRAVLVEDIGDYPINDGHYFEFMDSVGPDEWRWFTTRTIDPSRHPARGTNRRDPLLMRQQQ